MFNLIETNDDLILLNEELMELPYIGVDTEFLRKGKNDIRLSLIQINNCRETFIVDCLSIGEYQGNCNFFNSNGVTKIFHSSREDFEAIYNWSGLETTNIFDTQLANAFLGGNFSLSYQDLVEDILEVIINKDETRSNWLKRPLRDSQLRYAASDVEYLIEIYDYQHNMLEQSQKLSWFKDEIEFRHQKIISKEINQEVISRRHNVTKREEEDLLAKFNELVLLTSKENEINPTLFFSQKNQKEFLIEVLRTGIENALEKIPLWKKELVSEELCSLFCNI